MVTAKQKTLEWTSDRLHREFFVELDLRNKHPALEEAWEKYQLILKLVKQNE